MRNLIAEKLPEGMWDAAYVPVGDMESVHARAGFELGNHPEPGGTGRANLSIAQRMIEDQRYRRLPIVGSQTIVNSLVAFGEPAEDMTAFTGPSAAGVHENTGTRGELKQLKAIMEARDWERIAMYTSAWNIGNLMRQARLDDISIPFAVPPGLPVVLDPHSKGQPWVWNETLWKWSAPLRMIILHRKGH